IIARLIYRTCTYISNNIDKTMRWLFVRGNWGAAFQIGAVYVGTIVGAGFATGREIVEFFTQHGVYGLVGICISGFLFIWLGTRIMIIANRIQANSYKEFNEYLFGKKSGLMVSALMLLV